MKQYLVAIALAAFVAAPASAQNFPNRPIKMIVPFAPGGPNDLLARIIAQRAPETLGQSIIVENRGGAGGSIGTEAVAKSPADGYTLLLSSGSSLAVNPAIQKNVPYDPIKDFVPVLMVGQAPYFLFVSADFPAKSIAELIALAKAKPGTINYSSGGIGSTPHLAGELLKITAGINITHVPYKGSGPSLTALMTGEAPVNISSLSSFAPALASGKARALAVTTKERSRFMPDTPTMIESGVPGYDISNWYAVLAPAGTPKNIVARLTAAIEKSVSGPAAEKSFADLGIERVAMTSEEMTRHMQNDLARWTKVVKEAGITPE